MHTAATLATRLAAIRIRPNNSPNYSDLADYEYCGVLLVLVGSRCKLWVCGISVLSWYNEKPAALNTHNTDLLSYPTRVFCSAILASQQFSDMFLYSYIWLHCFCYQYFNIYLPTVLWQCWLGVRKSIQSVKIESWGIGVVICLQHGADCLHMVQLMPLHPKTPRYYASFKSRLVLPFWYRLTQVVLERGR